MDNEHPEIHVETVEPERWAARAADVTAAELTLALRKRPRATLAVSGGRSPRAYFQELSTRNVPWDRITILQVDEREVPEGSPERNLTDQIESFGDLDAHWLPLPVSAADDPRALKAFVEDLTNDAGDPPVIDVIHLGLGDDGHTASLVPGDPVLEERHHVIARTALYNGTHRLTLTEPVLSRAGLILWLVSGPNKGEAVQRLLARDPSIPGTMVNAERQVLVATPDVFGITRPH
ncbi:MAG: 6-phosphogluconolactonase [Acidimicrobiales bacterium]